MIIIPSIIIIVVVLLWITTMPLFILLIFLLLLMMMMMISTICRLWSSVIELHEKEVQATQQCTLTALHVTPTLTKSATP